MQPQTTSLQQQQATYFRSYERNIPSSPLQPYLDARPVLTKYALLPITDYRKTVPTSLRQFAVPAFNPGNDVGPWAGFATHVDFESELHNQKMSRECDPAVHFVPSSDSSLYQFKWHNVHPGTPQPFPDLFAQQRFAPSDPNPDKREVGYAPFNNATRQQMKNIHCGVPNINK